jgi:flagellar assembly protein FliH
MGKPQRFLFDVSFDRPDTEDPEGAETLEPRFTRAELDAARADAMAEGRKSALVEATQATDAKLAGTLASLTAAIERLLAERVRIEGEIERAAMTAVRAVLERAVPALTAKDPLAELEAFVARMLGEAFDEPRIVLRVSDALFEPVKTRLPALSQAAGYSGKLVLLADPDLAVGDAKIEWADGGAERDQRRLMAELDHILTTAPAPKLATDGEHTPVPEEPSHE